MAVANAVGVGLPPHPPLSLAPLHAAISSDLQYCPLFKPNFTFGSVGLRFYSTPVCAPAQLPSAPKAGSLSHTIHRTLVGGHARQHKAVEEQWALP